MGLTPHPLILEVMEPFNFVNKKGEKLNFTKTPKMALFNINLLGKVPKSTHNSLFSSKIHTLWYFWQEFYLDGLGQNGIDLCFIHESAFLVLKIYIFVLYDIREGYN